MAYDEIVVALIIDPASIARALPTWDPQIFAEDDYSFSSERFDAAVELSKLTGAPISLFSNENGDVWSMGLEITSGFGIIIDPTLITRAVQMKQAFTHPLVQQARLAAVTRFC